MGNIVDKIYRLKNAFTLTLPGYKESINFPPAQEFHIVNNVLYMGGHPLSMELQQPIINWIQTNPILFVIDVR